MSKVKQFKTTDNVVHDIYGQNVQGMDWDDYELLTPEQRNSDIAYFVPDAPSGLTLVEQTVSGLPAAVASFSNAADVPLKTLKVSINPVQAGSGDPSPTNPRPISGWTGANVTVDGKNILAKPIDNFSVEATVGNCFFVKAGTYTISYSINETHRLGLRMMDKDDNIYSSSDYIPRTGWAYNSSAKAYYAGADVSSGDKVFTINIITDCYIRIVSNKTSTSFSNAMLELGSSATTYEPYDTNSHVVPVSWQTEAGTVYGGELDVTIGVLTVNWKAIDLGSFDYTYGHYTYDYFKSKTAVSDFDGTDLSYMCSIYKTVTNTRGVNGLVGDNTFFIYPSDKCIYLRNDSYSDASAFKTAMSGIYVVYKSDTPITIQLTPTQVSSLLGANNIWADCGQVNECEYYIYGQGTKPQLYFNDDVYVGSEVIANPEDAEATEKLNKLVINGIVYDINPNVGERAIIDKLYEASTGDGAPLTTAINYTGGHKLSDYDIITVTLCDPTTYTGSIFSQVYSFSPKSLKSSGAQIPYFPIIMNGINDSECTVFFNENSFTVISHSGDTGEEPSVYSVYGLKFNTVAITEDIAGGDWTSLISQTGGSWSTATALPDGTTHVAVFLEYNNNVDMPFIFSVAEYDKIAQLSGNSIVQYGLAWKIGSDYDDIAYKYDSANGTVAVYAAYSGITIKAYAIAAKAAQIDVPIMQGATSSADGDKGLVPAPEAGDEDKFFKGDGTWGEVISGETVYGEASGAIASFNDGTANPLEEFVIGIEPVQASGTPTPSSSLPISGWTGANINIINKNLVDFSDLYFNDSTYTHTKNVSNYSKLKNAVEVFTKLIGKTIYYKATKTGTDQSGGQPIGAIRFMAGNSTVFTFYLNTPFTVPSFDKSTITSIYIFGSSTGASISNILISLNNSDDYIASATTIVPISWQTEAGTVYGGTITVYPDGSGEMDVSEKSTNYVGAETETWTVTEVGGGVYRFQIVPSDIINAGTSSINGIYCDKFKADAGSSSSGAMRQYSNRLWFYTDVATTVNDWKTWLSNNNVQVVYLIDTPIHIDFPSGTFPTINSLQGVNNIWSDTGDIDNCKYIRDLNSTINILWNAVFNQSNTRSLSLMKSVMNTDTKEIEETEEEETEKEVQKEIKKEGNTDENQR